MTSWVFALEEDNGFAVILSAHRGSVRHARVEQFPPSPFTPLGWAVADTQAEMRKLRAAGIRFERYAFVEQDRHNTGTTPNGTRVAWFKDPDGNTPSLAEATE